MQTIQRRRATARIPALDGLRALSVAAIVIYHVDDRLLPGGFVAVDLFFALSGYLVTTLLLKEREKTGAIGLRDFWKRRARRLWAAAWLVLAGIAVAGVFKVWTADTQSTLAGDIFGAVAHIANYWQLAQGGYLEQFAEPSPVRHFWTLAVEEQFYFVWPLVIAGGMTLVATRGRKAMWGILIGLAAASVTIGQFVSPERAYLGTGTRAIALIVGAVLAFAWSNTPLAAPRNKVIRRAAGVWAGVSTVGLAIAAFTLHPYDEVLRRGGFLLVALAGTGVIAQSLIPGRVQYWLSAAPLEWVGKRSYGIYLLHWPLIVAVGPGRPAWQVFLIVVPLMTLGAEALHRGIEIPSIQGRWSPRFMARATMSLATVTVLALFVAYPDTTAQEQVEADLVAVSDPTVDPTEGNVEAPGSPVTSTTTTTCVPAAAAQSQTNLTSADGLFDPSTVIDLADPGVATCGTQIDLLVVGDSTGRGFSNGLASLEDPNLRVWDRTNLGCSLGDEDCPDWRADWPTEVQAIDPEVVLLYFNPVDDLKGVDDADFLSLDGLEQKEVALTEAAELLSAQGAALVFVAVPTPRGPEGYFYCDGHSTDSRCDPAWVDAWNATVEKVAAEYEAPVLNVSGYVNDLPDDKAARPDGVHFAGDALVNVATWSRPIFDQAVYAKTQRDIAEAQEAFSN